MKGKIKLLLASLVLLAFLAESCGGGKTPYSSPKKGKHSRGGKRIKTDMGGYL